MELNKNNQYLYVLKASTIRHTDIPVLPVINNKQGRYINFLEKMSYGEG